MDKNLRRAYLVEFLGSFALVFFGAGVVLFNHTATPGSNHPLTGGMNSHQPGLVGIALAQGLILGALLTLGIPYGGGYFNPAITLMLWVFNRLPTNRTSWL